MSDTPTFGRYAEIPYERMTPEQQDGYNAMLAARGGLPGPAKIWIHNPKLAKVVGISIGSQRTSRSPPPRNSSASLSG